MPNRAHARMPGPATDPDVIAQRARFTENCRRAACVPARVTLARAPTHASSVICSGRQALTH
eukprot:9914260-Alexandrium_andersonii.AAC.1